MCRYEAKKTETDDAMEIDGTPAEGEGEFGFVTLDRTHTLSSFRAYADWAKRLHFGLKQQVPLPPGNKARHTLADQFSPTMMPVLKSTSAT